MYETALHENDKLKSRLRDSKQELAKIRSQLDKVTQVQQCVIITISLYYTLSMELIIINSEAFLMV